MRRLDSQTFTEIALSLVPLANAPTWVKAVWIEQELQARGLWRDDVFELVRPFLVTSRKRTEAEKAKLRPDPVPKVTAEQANAQIMVSRPTQSPEEAKWAPAYDDVPGKPVKPSQGAGPTVKPGLIHYSPEPVEPAASEPAIDDPEDYDLPVMEGFEQGPSLDGADLTPDQAELASAMHLLAVSARLEGDVEPAEVVAGSGPEEISYLIDEEDEGGAVADDAAADVVEIEPLLPADRAAEAADADDPAATEAAERIVAEEEQAAVAEIGASLEESEQQGGGGRAGLVEFIETTPEDEAGVEVEDEHEVVSEEPGPVAHEAVEPAASEISEDAEADEAEPVTSAVDDAVVSEDSSVEEEDETPEQVEAEADESDASVVASEIDQAEPVLEESLTAEETVSESEPEPLPDTPPAESVSGDAVPVVTPESRTMFIPSPAEYLATFDEPEATDEAAEAEAPDEPPAEESEAVDEPVTAEDRQEADRSDALDQWADAILQEPAAQARPRKPGADEPLDYGWPMPERETVQPSTDEVISDGQEEVAAAEVHAEVAEEQVTSGAADSTEEAEPPEAQESEKPDVAESQPVPEPAAEAESHAPGPAVDEPAEQVEEAPTPLQPETQAATGSALDEDSEKEASTKGRAKRSTPSQRKARRSQRKSKPAVQASSKKTASKPGPDEAPSVTASQPDAQRDAKEQPVSEAVPPVTADVPMRPIQPEQLDPSAVADSPASSTAAKPASKKKAATSAKASSKRRPEAKPPKQGKAALTESKPGDEQPQAPPSAASKSTESVAKPQDRAAKAGPGKTTAPAKPDVNSEPVPAAAASSSTKEKQPEPVSAQPRPESAEKKEKAATRKKTVEPTAESKTTKPTAKTAPKPAAKVKPAAETKPAKAAAPKSKAGKQAAASTAKTETADKTATKSKPAATKSKPSAPKRAKKQTAKTAAAPTQSAKRAARPAATAKKRTAPKPAAAPQPRKHREPYQPPAISPAAEIKKRIHRSVLSFSGIRDAAALADFHGIRIDTATDANRARLLFFDSVLKSQDNKWSESERRLEAALDEIGETGHSKIWRSAMEQSKRIHKKLNPKRKDPPAA